MNLDDKPLATLDLGRLTRLLKDIEAKVEVTQGPLNRLALEIVAAAFSAQRRLADVFGFRVGGEVPIPQVLMFYEFLYFFSHVTLRTLDAHDFTEPQFRTWQTFSSPLLSSTAVDSFFLHWPEDRKAKIRSEFYEKLNDSEVEYSECRGLLSPDDPLSANTLIGRLADNVADLWERSSDQLAKMAIASAATDAFSVMPLDRLVSEVAAVIDSVDSELIERFWREPRGA